MTNQMNEVYVLDAVRTPFGRAGDKGIFWNTRADDLVVTILKALAERNPGVAPDEVEDCIMGATNQIGEQGGTLGRMVTMLADWGWNVPGCSLDRMCASGLTTVSYGASFMASRMADCLVAGGVEHMGHLPMGYMRDNHPRATEVMGGESAFSMGQTAENLHDYAPQYTKEMCDMYAYQSQMRAKAAIEQGKNADMIVPVETTLSDGNTQMVDTDQHPRFETTPEKLQELKTPFRENGHVTAGNASGLNDGACTALMISGDKARQLGVQPRMRWVASAVAAVDPKLMGVAPVPATQKVLRKAGLSMKDMDLIEINEAFAIQVLYDLDQLGENPEDPRINPWGGSIAYGHPLAASGPRLVAFMLNHFRENPEAKYGLTTMCVGRGQGYSVIWENLG